MDRNPRHIFLDVTNVEANVDADTTQDFVTIEFAGVITATFKDRITQALMNGEFEVKAKKIGL